MDTVLLGMISTIDAWANYRESGWSNHIDWLVSALIDDFLASEEMQRERDRIDRRLIT